MDREAERKRRWIGSRQRWEPSRRIIEERGVARGAD